MKVLIGVDGSDGSFTAARFVGRLLDAERDELALYFTPEISVHDKGNTSPEILDRVRAALADAVFEKATEQFPLPLRQRVERIIGGQPPNRGVLIAADDWRAEMIVVGARGLGPLQKLMMGSVSTSVARGATVPVMVVHPPGKDSSEAAESGPLAALLASDGSPASAQAANFLSRLAWPDDTQGELVQVIEPMSISPLPSWLRDRVRTEEAASMARDWDEEHQAERAAAAAALAQLQQTLPACFQSAPPIVAEGHPAEQILALLKQRECDLVVVGARSLGAIQRFVVGSTSEAILAQATCSVLLVPEHPRP